MLLYVGVSVAGLGYVAYRGSPWADGKALMIVSPAVVLTAALGAVALFSLRRIAGVALAGALALGVLWSNALAYHNVSVAPRDRMAELAKIGERIDGQGPTLYPEFEEFAKHFLRRGAPEGTGEGWQRRYFLAVHRDGSGPLFGQPTDLDQFSDRYLETLPHDRPPPRASTARGRRRTTSARSPAATTTCGSDRLEASGS